jgi:N-acetylated-alpha-linked acidic dipeptidase
MSRILALAFLLLILPRPAPGASPPDAPSPLGFLGASRGAREKAERVFLATPTPESARRWLHRLTEEPHVAGTDGSRRVAEFVRDRFREFGLEAELATYHVLLNHPEHVALRMTEPAPVEIRLFEEGDPRDKDSFSRDAFPAFHGYGAAGKASAQVVYVNYGTDEDFRKLDEIGVSVSGRIVLVRYGKVFRGLKVREAQSRGAAGVLIFSDPADDGYAKGDVYPSGPMRPPSAIQRGSVQFLSLGPGDPQTPGIPSTRDARRIPREKLEGIPKIPSLPLSYGEAEKILRALAGPRVPDEWQGALPFAYHVGPGPAKVEMEVEMDYDVRPIHNVIGTIRGTAEPDRWVVLGNHHDAWTYGAVDPSSGTASLLETARGIGAAIRSGWRPRRTLILASWDAEEYGLVGSTEWGEQHAADLERKAVAYVNLDSSVTGPDLDVEGIPSLRDLLLEVAGELPDPLRGKSVAEIWRKKQHQEWVRTEPICVERDTDAVFRPALGALGSGSDYTVFLDHLGVAALSFSFSGGYGVYHSTLDNFFWMDNFGDPEFLYHAVAAKLYGLLAMRLAGAEVVPLRYVPYAEEMERQFAELSRQAVLERRRAAAAADKPPERPPVDLDRSVPAILAKFRAAAEGLDAALDAIPRRREAITPSSLTRLNDALVGVERRFLSRDGLPGRPWFRHLIYAPGLTTGYASWPFPGLRQAIKEHDAAMAKRETARLVRALEEAAEAVQAARRFAEEAAGR